MRELQSGDRVAESAIKDALEVPPKHLSAEQRAALIKQLQDAIALAERREQGVIAFGDRLFNVDADAPSE